MSLPRPPKFRPPCKVEGCDRDSEFRAGLCNLHYMRLRRNGSFEVKNTREVRSAADAFIFNNVNQLRLARNLSFNQLAKLAGIGKHTVNNLRTYDPSLPTLRALGAAFNVEYWRLLIPDEFKESQWNTTTNETQWVSVSKPSCSARATTPEQS